MLISILTFLFNSLFANNLQIVDLKKISSNEVEFTISWNNSWFTQSAPFNYDAVWVFFKLKTQNTGYQSVRVSENKLNIEIVNNPSLAIEQVDDAAGFFVKNVGLNSGNIANTVIRCKINTDLPETNFILKVFGIEMVYVPEGEFLVGDGISQQSFGNNKGEPFKITSENSIKTGTSDVELKENDIYGPTYELPADYPKGFAAFYCMKYEISQKQYADFLNCLPFAAQQNRITVSADLPSGTFALAQADNNFRNGIIILKPGNEQMPAQFACNLDISNEPNSENDGEHIACNFLNWPDVSSYLEWACLRPLTELEFEKAARGANNIPVKGEFAWGTAQIIDANTILNYGKANETITETATELAGIANHGYLGIMGPLRCGFATSATSHRLQAGASYYGVMELSGNLWEQVVGTLPEGIQFKRITGTGTLSSTGNHLQNYWPDWKTAGGACYRGGSWNSGIYAPGEFRDLAISDRFYANLAPELRRNTSGGRGAR